MNVVDSSCWLAYFADEPNAARYSPLLQKPQTLIVPTITLFEVHKVVCREAGREMATRIVGTMSKGIVIPLSPELALLASRVSLEHSLSLADSMIYATAQAFKATLWTQDAHFKRLDGVKYFPQ